MLTKTLDTDQEWRYDVEGSKLAQVVRVRPIKNGQLCVEFWATKLGSWTLASRRYCKVAEERPTIDSFFK